MKKRYFSSILLAMMVASGYAQSSALGNQMTAQQRPPRQYGGQGSG